MKTAFINCRLLDGTKDMKLQEGVTVVVEDGKIVSVGSGEAPADAKVYDLGGKYMMPGLINAHVHLPSSGKPGGSSKTPEQIEKMKKFKPILMYMKGLCKKSARLHLLSGTTTIRTVGGFESFDSEIRDEIKAGKYDGPRILASDMAVSVPGGHMAGVLAYMANTPEEGAAYVRQIHEKFRPDLIKLMITGGVLDAEVRGEPGVLRMKPEIVKACCDEAHRLGYKVAAHVESPLGVKVALENGVDTIEHSAMPDDEIIALFKERGAADICTISPAAPIANLSPAELKLPEAAQFNGKIVLDGIISCAKACAENGIPVGLGTDAGCPYVFHYDTWRELEYFRKATGSTPEAAIYAATLGNAEILGIASETGSVEPGKAADLLVVSGNPLEDFKALKQPSMVVFGGKVLKDPKIKKNEAVDRMLDELMPTV